MPKTIAVIDGNSLMHRAYHAVPPTMNAPDGTPTNAVFGFLSMLLKFVDIARPDAMICAFDAGKPEFRIKALQQYKAQRPPMDDDLRVQFPLMEELLESMNVPVVKVKGWEGDDILGTVAARAEAIGYDCLLITGDKDACQLASEHTRIVNTKKGISDVVIFDPAGVEEKYGVTPDQIPDYLGLMGDSSDNIPGVAGIGPKTASKLLQRFGSIEGIYENLDQLKGKQLDNLRENKDMAFLSRDIATIVRNLDFPLDLENASFPSYSEKDVSESFGKLRMSSHLAKVIGLIGESPASAQVDIIWGEFATEDEAAVIASRLIDDVKDVPLGVAVGHASQESLFDSGVILAVSNGEETAVLEGSAAESMFACIVREAPFICLNAKEALQEVYPADSAKPALVETQDLYRARFFDASLAAYVLDSSTSAYTIGVLAETYLGAMLPTAKTQQEALSLEASLMHSLYRPLKEKLDEDDDCNVYFDIDLSLVAVLAQMERIGAALDVERMREIGEVTQDDIDALVSEIYALAGEEFNIDSPKQVGHVLFEVVGLPPKKKTSRGYSTDAKVLGELAKDHPLPAAILKYRELAKIKSTYIDALPKMLKEDGRLHTSFNETVTTTGRLSSSNPNLQNIPVRTDFGRHIRECFVPLEKGEAFVSADYSQIELRVLAHLSADEHLVEAFRSGADFHAATAARVFGLPVEEITPELRSRAKAVNFGIVYGQQAFGLSQSLHIPFGEAQGLIDQYFQAYPGVRAYLDNVVASARENLYAETMTGRKRHIPELKASNAQQRAFGERTAMNHPMQGSAADIIKLAMVEVSKRINEQFPQAKLILQVHDELDLSVPLDQVEAVSTLLKDAMENIVELRVPLIVDVNAAENWAQAH